MSHELGIAHFVSQVDTVGKAVLVFLLILSIASWYLILTKTLANWREARRAKTFLEKFWKHDSVDKLSASLLQSKPDNAFANLTAEGVAALHNASGHGMQVGAINFAQEKIRLHLRRRAAQGNRKAGAQPGDAGDGGFHQSLRRPVWHGMGHLSCAGADWCFRARHAR